MYRNEFKQSILKSTRDYALCETVMRAFDSIFEADLANTVSTTQQTAQGTTGATGTVPVDPNKLADPDTAGVVNAKIADAQKKVKEAETAQATAVNELGQTIAALGGSNAGTTQQGVNEVQK